MLISQMESHADFALYEDQDKMIEAGIEMVSKRFNVLMDIIKENGLDLSEEFRKAHKKYQIKLQRLHRDLTNWELEHVGSQTFSKAFEPLIDYMFIEKAKNKGV